nr:LINE-type retrotransposon LIb DNA [Ipomoea batatas]
MKEDSLHWNLRHHLQAHEGKNLRWFPCSALALGVPPRLAVRHASLVRAKSFPSTGNGSGGHNQTKEVGCASIDIDVESDNEMDASDSADGIPLIKLQNELGKEMCQQWKFALIVKFLGKRISLSILLQRLPRMWGLQGKFELIDIGSGCFVAWFDNRV